MKKIRLAVVMMLVALFGMAMLAACGGGRKEGVYKFYSVTQEANGVKTEYFVGDEVSANTTLTEDFATCELTESGTFVLVMYGEKIIGTWKQNDENADKVDLTSDGSTVSVSCDGKTIEISNEGNVLILKK